MLRDLGLILTTAALLEYLHASRWLYKEAYQRGLRLGIVELILFYLFSPIGFAYGYAEAWWTYDQRKRKGQEPRD